MVCCGHDVKRYPLTEHAVLIQMFPAQLIKIIRIQVHGGRDIRMHGLQRDDVVHFPGSLQVVSAVIHYQPEVWSVDDIMVNVAKIRRNVNDRG